MEVGGWVHRVTAYDRSVRFDVLRISVFQGRKFHIT